MADVQVWFYSGFAVGLNGDTPLPKEPPIGYQRDVAVSTSNVEFAKPPLATLAVIETDAAIAYRVGSAADFATDPNIAATSNQRYAVDVSNGNLNIIANA